MIMIKSSLKFSPDFVESLKKNEVFVFGSNLNGVHAGGASLMAFRKFGAEWGQAEGPQGQCYAIPTDIRGEAVENVSAYLKKHIDKFIAYAKTHQEKTFLVTKIGCGNAGFDEDFMAPFLKECLDLKNVRLPKAFVEILTKGAEETNNSETQKVYNLIILDESGSMELIAQQAVNGLNETFQTISNAQKNHQEQQHFISFVTFNSEHIKTVLDRQLVDVSKKINWKEYYPNNCTPLYDAMGKSINELKKYVNDEDVVLVTIITDGMENASKMYSGSAIKELVGNLKKKGWVFAYIGTNQDVDAVADDMGIRSRMSYDYSPSGALYMFDAETSSKRRFFDRLHREGRHFMMDESYDYFDVDSKKEAEPKKDPEAEPQKEPDIVWDVKDEDQPTNTESEKAAEIPDKTKGLRKAICKLSIMLIIFMLATAYLLFQR